MRTPTELRTRRAAAALGPLRAAVLGTALAVLAPWASAQLQVQSGTQLGVQLPGVSVGGNASANANANTNANVGARADAQANANANAAANANARGGANARYQAERANCESGRTQQDRATCLREAGAAQDEARRGNLTSSNRVDANAMQRCGNLPGSQRADCESRIQGGANSSTSGSVGGGGIIRETITTVPVPAR